MKINDIATVFVRYLKFDDGKRRPILIVKVKNEFVLAFKITFKFASKSKSVRKNYFEITQWKKANLKKPSWVNLNAQPLEFPIKMVGKSFGHLSEKDRVSFYEFLKKRY
ncbi:hypothetical protein GA840_02285 [Pediococcus ethanolidurans]|uniref:hypothetical protein n=1 Tax=Pediococcus ethanolidurans TaxID=319653 RepID=UPI0029532009|nr:hypothetical protein [Pediococcus ethanolidurans]MDV7718697.1 hypothetical protein [Pediococcus ethanolidurans]